MPTIDPSQDSNGHHDDHDDDPYDYHRRYARLLGQFAQRLLDHLRVTDPPGQPTQPSEATPAAPLPLATLWEDTDAADAIDVWNALLEGAAAFTHNQRLRERLGELATQHTLAAVTAAQLW